MPRFVFRSLVLLAAAPAMLMAGCGGKEERAKADPANDDPALTGALADQIMVDPDLTGQNEVASGARMVVADGMLPTDNNAPEQAAAARSEAVALVGGPGAMKVLPGAKPTGGGKPQAAAFTAAARAAASSPTGAKCAATVEYTAAWAARLPALFPVYPRGNVQEAAGTDKDGCALRVVTFTTPVGLEDVLSFYYTRGVNAGYTTDRVLEGGDDMLGGTKGRSSYMVYARRLPSGRTEVDIVTSN